MANRKQSNYIQPDLQPEDLAKRLYENRPKQMAHHGPPTILRIEKYRGHTIRIETTYKITVDGKPVSGHLDVVNSGHVHYHPLPNRSTVSAVGMVCAIIDSFPDDFPSSKKGGHSMKDSTHKKTRKKVGGKEVDTAKKSAAGSRRTRSKGGR